jgi:hypothetical protein
MIFKLIVRSPSFADHNEFDQQVQFKVVKTLKPVLCSSRDGVPLNIKKKYFRYYSLSVRIILAQFRPLLHLAGQYL